MAQGAAGGILHHEKRQALVDREVEHAHNMGMAEADQGACLRHKACRLLRAEPAVQEFERSQALQVDVFAQVHVSKAPVPQQAQ